MLYNVLFNDTFVTGFCFMHSFSRTLLMPCSTSWWRPQKRTPMIPWCSMLWLVICQAIWVITLGYNFNHYNANCEWEDGITFLYINLSTTLLSSYINYRNISLIWVWWRAVVPRNLGAVNKWTLEPSRVRAIYLFVTWSACFQLSTCPFWFGCAFLLLHDDDDGTIDDDDNNNINFDSDNCRVKRAYVCSDTWIETFHF